MSHLIMQQNQMMNVQGQVTLNISKVAGKILIIMDNDGDDLWYYLFLDAKYTHEPVAKYVDATERHG